jgi:hypothetical protein
VLADEELLRGDRIKQFVERTLQGWRPKVETVDTYTKGFRSALGKVFDRTAAVHFKKMRSSARISSIEHIAAQWLDDQGAQAVKSIMDTTREQLASALADGVRQGKTAKEISSDIRSQFESIPAGRAKVIALTEIPRAYNFATVHAGLAAGVKKAQLLDGIDHDVRCKNRNGRIVDLEDAVEEDLHHPCCQFCVRLLTKSSANLEVRHELLAGDVAGRYDHEAETILLAPDLDPAVEVDYLLALGATLA